MNKVPNYVRLDYATLGREYENRLETMERGFSMDADFLEAWVPDDDIDKSLFYLFEAASLHRLSGLSVVLVSDLLSSIDNEALMKTLKTLGRVHVAHETGRVVLTISFGADPNPSETLDGIKGLSSLARTYRDKLIRETHTLTHVLTSPLPSGHCTIAAEFQDGTVLVVVNPVNDRISAMRHTGMYDSAGSRMLDLLCRLMEGVPIQELSEHGVLRLENVLRNSLMPPPVRGLITPDNAGPEFAALNRLVRQLFRKYRDEYVKTVERNVSEFPISLQWQSYSDAERDQAVSKGIAEFLESHNFSKVKVQVQQLANLTQVFASIDGCDSEQERRMLFRALEKELKRKVEPRLELYLPSMQDRLQREHKSDLMKDSERWETR